MNERSAWLALLTVVGILLAGVAASAADEAPAETRLVPASIILGPALSPDGERLARISHRVKNYGIDGGGPAD